MNWPLLIEEMIDWYRWRLKIRVLNRQYHNRITVINNHLCLTYPSINLGRRVQIYQYRHLRHLNPDELWIYSYLPAPKFRNTFSRKVARLPLRYYYSNQDRPR